MNGDLWRWADPQGQQREVRLDELRAALAEGHIAPNTPVWRSGWHGWQPAHDVPELTSASLGAANGVVLNIPPPPLAMLAVQQEYEASSASIAPAPLPPPATPSDDPPPPPAYVPLPVKAASIRPSSGPLKTQLGGSAYVPTAQGTSSTSFGAPPSDVAQSSAPPALGRSLPTAIGLPPPPELIAMGAAAAGPTAPPRPPAADGASFGQHPTGVSVDGGYPYPTSPVVVGEHGDDESDARHDAAGLPRQPGLGLLLEDVARIRAGQPPRNKLLVGVAGVLALSVLIMLGAGVATIASGPSSGDTTKASASASAHSAAPSLAPSTAPPVVTSAGPSKAAPPVAPPSSDPTFGDCEVAGDAKTIAPRAQIASGIEAHALGAGLAMGFAPGSRDAAAISLDPSSLAPTATARAKASGGEARRVTPMLVNGKLTAFADVDRRGDKLRSRRVVATSTPIDVGVADGSIVWSPHGRDSFAKLFALDGEGAVEALRATALGGRKGIAITFRRGHSVHVGIARGDGALEPDGELSKVPGLGQVGSPSIAASGDDVVVAWADRAGADDDWSIRWVKVKIGGQAHEATTFAIPDGGLGGQAMSPSVASLGGGRFLLAWTEGPVSNHQVRAIAIGADGAPAGSVMAISASGVNAGQPAAVVAPDGRGAIAFLAAKAKGLELQATPIRCSPR